MQSLGYVARVRALAAYIQLGFRVLSVFQGLSGVVVKCLMYIRDSTTLCCGCCWGLRHGGQDIWGLCYACCCTSTAAAACFSSRRRPPNGSYAQGRAVNEAVQLLPSEGTWCWKRYALLVLW